MHDRSGSSAARPILPALGACLLLVIACGPSEDAATPAAQAGTGGGAGVSGSAAGGYSGGAGTPGGAAGTAGASTGGASGGAGRSNGGSAGAAAAGAGATGGASAGNAGAGATAGASAGNAGAGAGGESASAGQGGALGGGAGTQAGTSGAAGSMSGASGSAGAPPTGPLTLYLAGDSTVSTYDDTASPSDQAGWGQMFDAEFDELVTVENRAIGGRTARRFIDEGKLDGIFQDIAAGDYLFVQFGTNDGNRTATYELEGQTIPYYLDPATDFKTYLMQYIEGARSRDAIPVLVTPPPRNSAYCTGGNGTGAHAAAMRELGAAENVAVADLNQKTVDHLKAICPAPTPEDFFFVRSDGSVDGTHFQENGARIMAGFVADGVREAGLPLSALLE